MRLISTTTGAFEEFIGQNKPDYAILSHTWGCEEVSYKDYGDPSCFYKKGYQKIKMSCKLAAEAGIKYIWVDTCNIDKSSSAELTEAINSMFHWYQRSQVCYVVLEDLPVFASTKSMTKCRWFKRGWTLQELIAPTHVVFYDQDWNYRGSKVDLAELLSEITNIDIEVLLNRRLLSTMAVAQRMSWAALRETTRIEDMAYCLLGIFNVNMPLLYGEGGKAFRRLQEEIIKSTSDLSIFAWSLPEIPESAITTQGRTVCGVLAQTPAAFASCMSLIHNSDHVPEEYAVTNIGIKTRIQLLTLTFMRGDEPKLGYVLPLRCSSDSMRAIGVQLRKCGFDQFVREDPWTLIECVRNIYPNAAKDSYLLTELLGMELHPIMSMNPYLLRLRTHVLQFKCDPGISIYDAWNWSRFDEKDQLFFVSGNTDWDSSSIRFDVKIPEQRHVVACSFHAVQWSSLERYSFQYTLVEDQALTSSLNQIQNQLTGLNAVSTQVIENLIYLNIPRTSSVAIKYPGMRKTALISCETSIEENTNICLNKFWQVRFSVQLLEDKNVPKISQLEWHH